MNLRKYTWGLGLEHEMHIFHKPKNSKNKPIKDFLIFDSYAAMNRILDDYDRGLVDVSDDDILFLKSIPFERSGRRCNEKWVIKRVPIEMPEFVTMNPFCSIDKKRDILSLSNGIVYWKEKYYKILMKDKITNKLVKKYGELVEYPSGMTRHLKVPKLIGSSYKNTKNDNTLTEYNGSYHITFTLPYTPKIKKSDFIKMHQNFCNQLQWIEPLLLTAYFTGDEMAPGSLEKRVRGSFRVMIIGWGNLAGTDVRLLSKGIGRYAKTPTYWRKNLKFYESDKLKPCYKPSPAALQEDAITTLSSDIRTFGSTDPDRPEHRESGVGMTVPNGIEFRIFDHFQDKYIENLVQLVGLIAENSRVTKTKGYVYQNKVWIEALHQIMKHGYRAELNIKYISLLRVKLGLKIDTKSIIAFDVFKTVYDELWNKNVNGDWNKIFNCMKKPHKEIIPQVNKRGWELGFMVKANRNKKVLKSFNSISSQLNDIRVISMENFHKMVVKIMGKSWIHDSADLAYFYNDLDYVKLDKNEDGTIKNIIMKQNIPKFKDFNKIIITYFENDYTLLNLKFKNNK